jgi:small GTP-binding protein
MTAEPIFSFKFIIVGSSGVGKTALLRRLTSDTFSPDSHSTIGVEYDSTVVEIDQQMIKLQIWDTAGQEKFRSIAKAYFRNAVGVLLCFDLTDQQTFDDVSMWLNEIRSICDQSIVILLIGNKSDLIPKRVITMTEAEHYAQHNHLNYLETSASNGTNVREAFVRLATAVYRRTPKTKTTINSPVSKKSKEKDCC